MAVVPVVRGSRIVYEPVPDRLQEVSESYPSPAVKTAAETALRAAVADLGLPSATRIIWCVVEGETSRTMREQYGETPWRTVELAGDAPRGQVHPAEPDVLWVRADLEPEATAETTKHECRHSWQLEPSARRWLLPGLETYEERERDALAYGQRQLAAPRYQPSPAPTRRPSPATRSYRYPSEAEAARAERRAAFFEHKGQRCWRCANCAEITPLNVTHHCPAVSRGWH